MDILKRIQRLLSHIYRVNLEQDVDNFVFSDPKLLAALSKSEQRISQSEALLIKQCENELQLSLYLDDELLNRLRRLDPTSSLHEGNMNDFWVALEGVSHFMYVVRRAGSGETFSLLELELQAEVDKFIASVFLIKRQANKRLGKILHRLLFEDAGLDGNMEEAERNRYRDANYYASRYCWQLSQKYFFDTSRGVVEELRQFYRLPHQAKIRRIDHGVYGGVGL